MILCVSDALLQCVLLSRPLSQNFRLQFIAMTAQAFHSLQNISDPVGFVFARPPSNKFCLCPAHICVLLKPPACAPVTKRLQRLRLFIEEKKTQSCCNIYTQADILLVLLIPLNLETFPFSAFQITRRHVLLPSRKFINSKFPGYLSVCFRFTLCFV